MPLSLIPAPDYLYAIVQKDEETRQPIPVLALAMKNDRLLAYIPLKDELVPTTEVEMFVEFYCGDPDLYTFDADDEKIDDDEDEDEDEDDDYEEADPEDEEDEEDEEDDK